MLPTSQSSAAGASIGVVRDTYTHGHQESVLRSHRWRTADNSAAYLLGHLRAGQRLLDVGCGPGTITVDLARRVAPGPTVGVDASAAVVAEAQTTAQSSGASTVTFLTGDVYALDSDDASFDVVHAHQVLQHLSDPVAALGEMRRVLAPGGILAVRDSDYGVFSWTPPNAMLERWLDIYHQVTACNGAEADAGRFLEGWVRAAGFTDVRPTTSAWTFASPEERQWWGSLWAERTVSSAFAEQAVGYGVCRAGELEAIREGWLHWAAASDGTFVVPHGEACAIR
ncbi:MAG: methyltransferase domain-containing protein [Acidimicrobiales bacterium]